MEHVKSGLRLFVALQFGVAMALATVALWAWLVSLVLKWSGS